MNLPTKITVARIALIPLMLVFYCLQSVISWAYIAVTVIFVAAAFTDFVDGYLARKHNMVTDLGKFLDPIADKILVVAAFVIIVEQNLLPAPWGGLMVVIILAREFIIGVFRQIAAAKGAVLAADNWGKAKTVCTMLALPPLLLTPMRELYSANAIIKVGEALYVIGLIMFIIATVLTVISGINYIVKNAGVFKEGK